MDELKFSKLERLLNTCMGMAYQAQLLRKQIEKDYKLQLETLCEKLTPLTPEELEELEEEADKLGLKMEQKIST